MSCVWLDVQSLVKRTYPPPANDLPHGYAFPDAALFGGVKTPEKTSAWLAHHSALIFQFIPHDSDASPLSGDHWCAFLSGSIEQVHDKDWRKEKKDYMRGMLGNAVKDFGGASEEVHSDIHFQGTKVSAKGPISADVAQEVLWEISELNFQVELSALDHYALALSFDSRHSSILRCFASCPGNLYAVKF